MRYVWRKQDATWLLMAGETIVLSIPVQEGCKDDFESLGEGAFRWTRTCAQPSIQMTMTIKSNAQCRYWQVPAVNYNGNGWGRGAQYTGWARDGQPWCYAWHRTAIPACTYSESENWCISLFGEEKGGMSGSICMEEGCAVQSLLWPEQEGPSVLFKRAWLEPFMGTMEPASTFTAIIHVFPAGKLREGYRRLLDFAWDYFHRDVQMQKSPEEIIRLDTCFLRSLWQRKPDGVTGFQTGMHWVESENAFVKSTNFELGWTGQNPSVACILLREYKKTGDEDLKNKALSVLDSWMKYARLPNGMMFCKLFCDPNRLDSVINGDIPTTFDACNLGTGAVYLFKAARLCKELDIDRPEYSNAAMGLCDFALRSQQESGEFAKSWYLDGSVDARHGVIGVFMALPLFDAYDQTGERKYLDAALRAVDFYLSEFDRCGYTTAGALDSYCIDKESAAPLLRAALTAYRYTNDQRYVEAAEGVAYYLSTWQWHYTVDFPRGSMAREVGFDTYGSTAVSAAHNALDHYGLYFVPEFIELAELTGKEMWRSRARALWYAGTQLISDGTLTVKGRVRPAGSQDESVRHTRWGRPDRKYFTTSEWLTHWQTSFREVALDRLSNWDDLR